MENHSTTTIGGYRDTYYDGSSEALVPAIRSLDEVSGHSRVKGDAKRVKPTAFTYTTQHRLSYDGTIATAMSGYAPYYKQRIGNTSDSVLNYISLTPDWNRHYNTALSRLYEKIRGELDLSIAVAEMHQTKALLGSLHKLETYVVKGGPWWKNGLKGAGKNWLAAHLGWTPLLQDIFGAADEFTNHLYSGMFLKIRASSKEKFDASQFIISSGPVSQKRNPSFLEGKQGVMFNCAYDPGAGFDISRWSSLNPVSIAWELMPYSFVVDYVYDIGSYLRSLETSCLMSARFFSGYYTQLYAVDVEDRLRGVFNRTSPSNYQVLDVMSSAHYSKFNRVPFSSAPLPRAPSFVVPTSWQKLLTVAGLLAQHLR